MGQPDDTPAQTTLAESVEARASGGLFGFIEKILPVLILLALLVHPTQVTVRQWADILAGLLGEPGWAMWVAGHVPAINVTLSDGLFVAAFLLWAVLRWRQGALGRQLRQYPLALLVMLVCLAFSTFPFLKPSAGFTGRTFSANSAVKQLIQLVLFFVCSYLVLADYLSNRHWQKKLLFVFFAAAYIALLAGLWEYLLFRPTPPQQPGPNASALAVDATFGLTRQAASCDTGGTVSNRNVLGAWLTLVLPLLWGVFLYARGVRLKGAALIMVLIGGLLLLQGGLWAAALLAILAMSFVKGRTVFVATAVGMLLFYGIVFSFGPQKHGQILADSVMLRTKFDRFRTLRPYEDDAKFERSGRKLAMPWQQKYIEWQPALLALSHDPLFGVGLGNYQDNINNFYDKAPECYRINKPPVNLMEPGGNSFYAVLLVETGFVGLLGFVWMLMAFFQRAADGYKMEGDDLIRGLKLGALGALGAMCLGCAFTEYWVRGVGTALVFLLAFCSASSD